MRQKKVKHALDTINSNHNIVIPNPKELKSKWKSIFNNSNDIHIEIGTGKGKFIHELAINNPDINYIGIERYDSVLIRALEKVLDSKISNLKFIMIDAIELLEVFDKDEISQIYLNFSDPWPKTRHEKRRLTYETYLNIYKTILPQDKLLVFKTDNRSLFEYSLYSLNKFGTNFKSVCLDLHNSEEEYPDNIKTEYEIKFSEKGFPIYQIEVLFNE